jgi:hypothetical protein
MQPVQKEVLKGETMKIKFTCPNCQKEVNAYMGTLNIEVDSRPNTCEDIIEKAKLDLARAVEMKVQEISQLKPKTLAVIGKTEECSQSNATNRTSKDMSNDQA